MRLGKAEAGSTSHRHRDKKDKEQERVDSQIPVHTTTCVSEKNDVTSCSPSKSCSMNCVSMMT